MPRLPYREIIEMRSVGLSERKVASLCGCGVKKVGEVIGSARRLGIGWPVPAELSDDELEQLVDPLNPWRRHQPDFPAIREILGGCLKKKDLDAAYDAYVAEAQLASTKPYVKATFKRALLNWLGSSGEGVSMRINWAAGEEVQVDWAGRTLGIVGADGRTAPAFLFVATMPYSGYTFIRASLDMGMQTWLEHHCSMFEFFGGVPIWLAPDNLAQAVYFKKGGGKVVNRKYQDLADHYGIMVEPTRVATPTDKGAVEGHVRIMANRAMKTLEGLSFSSINQLNRAVSELLALYNSKPSPALGGMSRHELFVVDELPCLQRLPEEPYSPCSWRSCRVAKDDVVAVRGNHYGVPEGHAGSKARVRIGVNDISIFTGDGRQLLAEYPRREDGSETFDGLPGVCPDRFRPLSDWCAGNGRTLLLDQWDFQKNGDLTPGDIVCRSHKKVWWKCPDCGFEWEEAVARRTQRGFDDCLACCGVELVAGKNDLATLFPEIAEEWHPDKNPLSPSEVFSDYRQRVWWLGKCGHEWCAPIAKRVGSAVGRLCPYCSGRKALKGFNDVVTVCPELAAHWHPAKNRGLWPEKTSILAPHAVYLWDGPLSHIWRETPRSWMVRHGMADRIEPFEAVCREAKAIDSSDETSSMQRLGRGKSTVKWARFITGTGLRGMSLQDWCLAFNHEELLKEWDGDRNGGLLPRDVPYSSQEKAWWKGSCGHEWRASVRDRVYDGNGCVYCSRARILPGYSSAASLAPATLKLWHPTKNGDLTPADVSDRDHRRFWWQCPVCGYEWQEGLRKTNSHSRTCPSCNKERSGYLVAGRNRASDKERLSELWAGDLNGGMALDKCFTKAKKPFWWRGKCGHVWKARIDRVSVIKGEPCPYCGNRKLLKGFNDLATVRPDVAALWDADLNGGATPDTVRFNSGEAAWWRSEGCGHSWKMKVSSAVASEGRCPYCSGKRLLKGFNDLQTADPALAAQWHPTKNGDLGPDDVMPGSSRLRIWWICGHGHEWADSVNNRHRNGSGCPVCSNKKCVSGVNDLQTTHRKLAKQWDEERNGSLKARDVTARSHKKVWWRCGEGHSFAMEIFRRAGERDPGCPYCKGRKALPGFNDLATTYPELMKEWNKIQNRRMDPREILPSSSKEAWWIAPCGHHFMLSIRKKARAKPGYCPICSGRMKIERPVKLK